MGRMNFRTLLGSDTQSLLEVWLYWVYFLFLRIYGLVHRSLDRVQLVPMYVLVPSTLTVTGSRSGVWSGHGLQHPNCVAAGK